MYVVIFLASFGTLVGAMPHMGCDSSNGISNPALDIIRVDDVLLSEGLEQ